MPPAKAIQNATLDLPVTIEGYGNCQGSNHKGTATRLDDKFLVIRMMGHNNQPSDKKFHLDGTLCGSHEAAGFRIAADDLKTISQRLGLLSGDNAASNPEEDQSTMSAKTIEKATKLTVVAGGKAVAAKQEKNGHKPAPAEPVKTKAKAKPAVEEDEEEEEESAPVARKAANRAKTAVPASAPSPKAGKAVNTSGKGRKAGADEEEEAASPKKRGRKPEYIIPAVGKGEIQIEVTEGAYASLGENFLPNTKSKKTTDIEKEFVSRFKNGYMAKKRVYINLTKPTAEVFLAITENAAEAWSEMGVAGSHFARATTREADKLRAGFKLKGGINFSPVDRTPKAAPAAAPAPKAKTIAKAAPAPVVKAAAKAVVAKPVVKAATGKAVVAKADVKPAKTVAKK